MAKIAEVKRPLRDHLSRKGPLDPSTASRILRAVAAEVATLHASGQTHRAIGSDTVRVDQRSRPELAQPESVVRVGGADPSGSSWPVELQRVDSLQLPVDIKAATSALKRAGVSLDPRRIDVYQLGSLACLLLTARTPRAYLQSPKVKSTVPATWQPLIDRSLGYDPTDPISSCDQFIRELNALRPVPLTESFADTPPSGTGVDVRRDTPAAGNLQGQSPSGGPLLADSDDELPFDRLGHFQVVARLGHGGMGDVYRGYEESLDRTVAIKALPPELARQKDFVHRFTTEAKAAASLVHPNIVRIYFIGEDQGHHFFAMQFVDGETLGDLLKREGRMGLQQGLDVAQQVLSGLAEAHRHGMVHRDIKPSNILLDATSGKALLADFGLVKSLGSSARVTATGMIMGTVDYISPEQGRGKTVDGRSDLYSIGVLMYQLFSGQLPFEADSPTAMVFQHAYEQPQPLEEIAPGVPRRIGSIITRLMSKDPEDRYQTADAVIADIVAVREGRPASLPPSISAGSADSADAAGQDTGFHVAGDFESLSGRDQASSTFVALPRQGWVDRLRALFYRHAPKAVLDLQNTEHQVTGALAEYEGRRNKLAELAREAKEIQRQLDSQVVNHEEAAAEAARCASASKDLRRAQSLRSDQREYEETARSFALRRDEQRKQSDDIRSRLAVADATLNRLRSQRDVLNARLRTAEAGVRLAGGAAKRRWQVPRAAAVAIAAVSVFLAVASLLAFLPRTEHVPAGGAVPRKDRTPLPPAPEQPATEDVAIPLDPSNFSWRAFVEYPAEVRVKKFTPERLRESEKGPWTTVPRTLSDSNLVSYSGESDGVGVVEFSVDGSGFVLLACNYSYQGNSSGDWTDKRWTAEQFVENGWTMLAVEETGGPLVWKHKREQVLFARFLNEGETYRLRCNKYDPPFVIIPRPPEALPPLPLSGSFFAVAKGQFELFLNGDHVPLSEFRSSVRQIKPDDVVAVRVNSPWVDRAFRLAFVAEDGTAHVAFTPNDFILVDDQTHVSQIRLGNLPDTEIRAVYGKPDPNHQEAWDRLNLPAHESGWVWGPGKDQWFQYVAVVGRDMIYAE